MYVVLAGHAELLDVYAEFVCVSFSDSRIVSTGNLVINRMHEMSSSWVPYWCTIFCHKEMIKLS